MRRLQTLGILAALASTCLGQDLRLVPDIAVAEAEYRDATDAWLQNDPNLERDLLKGNPEEMRKRIRRAAALSDDAMVKKAAFLDLLAQRLRDMRQRVAQAQGNNGTIPIAALKKDLENQQSRILGEQERLEALLNDLPPGDEYLLVRRPLEEERTNLVNLQNNIALRLRSLDSTDKAQQAIQSASAGPPLTQKLDDLLKIWDQEKAATAKRRTMLANLYATMDRAVSGKSGGAPQPAAPVAKVKEPDRRHAAAASVKAEGLGGIWVYRSQPGAWTGFGEPEMVTLQLKEEGDAVRGTYAALLPSRGGPHEVVLVLEGTRQAPGVARLHWTSQTPAAEGEIELKLSADGRLLAERTKSADGYIPLGSEVLLRQ